MDGIPPARDSDAEDVVWALQTADTLWKRDERVDAIVWLRRAAQSAGELEQDDRALELARSAAELSDWMARNPITSHSHIPSAPPGAGEGVDDLLTSLPEHSQATASVDAFLAETPGPAAPPEVSTSVDDLMTIEVDMDARPEPSQAAIYRSVLHEPEEAPSAAEAHAGILDPWAPERAPAVPAADLTLPTVPALAGDYDDDEDVVTSARMEVVSPAAASGPKKSPPPVPRKPPPPRPVPRPASVAPAPASNEDPTLELASPAAALPRPEPTLASAQQASAQPAPVSEPPPVPEAPPVVAAPVPTPVPAPVEEPPAPAPAPVEVEPAPAPIVEAVAAPAAAPTSRPFDLSAVDALADLPDEARDELERNATVHRLARDEEIMGFALAYVIEGSVDVAAQIVDTPAERLQVGSVLKGKGTVAESVPLRLVGASESSVVATWEAAQIEPAFKSCPWVEDELRERANHVQALVGVTLGPLADRLDASIRQQVTSRLRLRELAEGEIEVDVGVPVKELCIVGQGCIELVDPDGQVIGTVGAGDILFAQEIMAGGKAPSRARAGAGGALVLVADRGVAQELMVTCPPLLEIFAGI